MWRFCHLNLVTKADKYPVPNLADFSGQLEGCTVLSAGPIGAVSSSQDTRHYAILTF